MIHTRKNSQNNKSNFLVVHISRFVISRPGKYQHVVKSAPSNTLTVNQTHPIVRELPRLSCHVFIDSPEYESGTLHQQGSATCQIATLVNVLDGAERNLVFNGYTGYHRQCIEYGYNKCRECPHSANV